jgi:hypothetical protein
MTYPEWAPFDKSEGRPVHPDRGPEVMAQTTKNGTKDVLSNGNEIIKTANHFVIIIGDKPEKALMSLKTTQLKTSRGWNSLMDNEFIIAVDTGKSIPAPAFSRIYQIKSVENSGNFTWHGMTVNLVKPVDNAEIFSMAVEFNSALQKSNVAAASVENNKVESNY